MSHTARRSTLVSWLGITLFALAAAAGAETVYKSTDRDGNTTYSSKPPRNAGDKSKTEEMTIDPNRNVLPAEPVRPVTPANATYGNSNDNGDAPRSAVAEAEAALREAERALAEGQQTQPGDFQGKAGGGVRPSIQRTERINELQSAVDRARETLERARSGTQ